MRTAAGADESGEIGECHDPETHLIPLALQAAAGTGPELQVFGNDYPTPDGTCIRDYIHVNDLADAHVKALKHLEKQGNCVAANLGTGQGNSVMEVVNMVEQVTGKKVPRKMTGRRAGDPPSLVADPTYAQKLLRWKATRSLRNIVSSAWQWEQRKKI
jgi:UDP-glucose 4-epimerase